MREYTVPEKVSVDPETTVQDLLWEVERTHPNRAALAYRDGDRFVDVSTKDLAEEVRRLAAGFIGLGIEPGSRICLFSPTRIEFTYLDYAIWTAGCATVTIYETSSAEQVEWIVSDSGAVAIVCATDELEKIFHEKAGQLGTVPHVFSMESGGLEALKEAGASVTDEQVMERSNAVQQSDLATLVYTSGTTGRPKGCILTHHNFVYDVLQTVALVPDVLYDGASTLMFLPLAHIFARLVQVGSVHAGSKIAFSTGVPQLLEEVAMVKPTWLFSVPRVFEKIYNGAVSSAAADGKGAIFERAVQVAVDYSTQTQSGGAKLGTRVLHAVFDRLVYSKLRDRLGGRAKFAVSGGAPLGKRLGHFFNGAGITVLEGYGLTETTAAATVNASSAMRVGSVGQPLPGTTIRIADDGEVLIRGPHVFGGYWNNEAATAEAIDADGWFHTGDIGELDEDGFLAITGRKKEIIVTAGGKNVAPAVLEDRLRAHPLVSQCMVIGDAQPFIACLVTVDPDEWPGWAEAHGKSGTVADNLEDADLKAEIESAIADANNAVSKAEAIKAFRILPDDFTIEGGELTPTLKVKRKVVADKYASVMTQIYGN